MKDKILKDLAQEAKLERRREIYKIIVGGILFYGISVILITYGALYVQG